MRRRRIEKKDRRINEKKGQKTDSENKKGAV